jgi:glycosyltransferase involved in cell wall biosynthesis
MSVVPEWCAQAPGLTSKNLGPAGPSFEGKGLEAQSIESQSIESQSIESQCIEEQSSAAGYHCSVLPVEPPYWTGPADRPLRVIHAGPGLMRGGAEQWLVDLLRFLDPKKIQFLRAISVYPQLTDPDFTADLPIPVEVGQADSVRRAAAECDILLSWGLPLNEWLKDCRPRLSVVLAHGEGEWTRKLLQASDQVIDHVIAVSRAVKDRCCQGFPTSVIYNGVDCSRLGRTRSRDAVRASLGFQPGDFVLGYLGRYSPEKRVPLLLEAAALLPPHFKVLMVGWGAQRVPLLEQANSRIPGRYALANAWNYLGDYYQAMDAVCLVSEVEGCPLVLIEARLCGRPVIVTSFGCASEVVEDRINGLVVSADPASIAGAALQLARHPEWARGVAAEGKAYAEEHGHVRRMAMEYENLLLRLWREKNAT